MKVYIVPYLSPKTVWFNDNIERIELEINNYFEQVTGYKNIDEVYIGLYYNEFFIPSKRNIKYTKTNKKLDFNISFSFEKFKDMSHEQILNSFINEIISETIKVIKDLKIPTGINQEETINIEEMDEKLFWDIIGSCKKENIQCIENYLKNLKYEEVVAFQLRFRKQLFILEDALNKKGKKIKNFNFLSTDGLIYMLCGILLMGKDIYYEVINNFKFDYYTTEILKGEELLFIADKAFAHNPNWKFLELPSEYANNKYGVL